METIIIQYCDNDIGENIKFLRDKCSFINPSKNQLKNYKRALKFKNKHQLEFGENIKFITYPLIIKNFYKQLYSIAISKIKTLNQENNSKFMQSYHSKTFQKVITNFPNLHKNKRIIIFISNTRGQNIERYNEFKKYFNGVNLSNYSSLEIISPEETSLVPGNDSFFILDDHINANGHRKLGKALLEILER